ncbi:hypothetical protein PLESTB_001523500 [Pleodorina starrii]|uniref:phytol kinase n=1 Tax=Pleodorina starrii TaxID=330485 RepID=A0A9W6BWA5_9CHLO|nr:hypothetical protein PLESTM_001869500 [Pleodorina starrii]GLC59696.1 hypothetical protein PLESTB_001523500 [Pleodorina starrii]GLC74662.1 hypothetical protein PLESTF_001540700 [Pleodorina starrii]
MPPRARPQRRRAVDPVTERTKIVDGLAVCLANGDTDIAQDRLSDFVDTFSDVSISQLMVTVNEATAVDLFTLFSLALRRSNGAGVDLGARTCYRKLRHAVSAHLSDALSSNPEEHLQRIELLAQLLLRTEALQCYAGLLRDVGQQVQQRPSRNNVEAAAELLSEVAALLAALERALMRIQTKRTVLADWLIKRCLPTQFDKSGLLDAWASCFLQLAATGECGSNQEAELLRSFVVALECLESIYLAMCLAICRTAGPGLLYLLSAHVVRAMAMLDGGTTYGMEAGGAPQVPLLTPDGAAVRSDRGDVLDPKVLLFALTYWEHLLDSSWDSHAPASFAAAFPPYHRPATFDLCIRLVDVAVATASAPAAAAQQQQRRRSGPLLLKRSTCGTVASSALQRAEVALRELISRKPAGLAQKDVERLRRFWAAYMRVLDAAMHGLVASALSPATAAGPAGAAAWLGGASSSTSHMRFGGDWSGFTVIPVGNMESSSEGLPTQLGAEAEIVLSTGVLARMERLMRMQVRPSKLLCGTAIWTQLAMFGPVDQVAALIATASKYVRSCALFVEQRTKKDPRQPAGAAFCTDMVSAHLPQGISTAAELLAATIFVWAQQPPNEARRSSSSSCVAGAGSAGGGFGSNSSGCGGASSSSNCGEGDRDAGGNGADGGNAGDDAATGAGGASSGVDARVTDDGACCGSSTDGRGSNAGGGSGGPATSTQQLEELASFAAVRLLPAVAKAVHCFESPAFACWAAHSKATADTFLPLTTTLLCCQSLLLLALPARADARPSGPAPNELAPCVAMPAPAAAQWRALLLHEVDLVGLLGAAAKALSTLGSNTQRENVPVCGEAFAGVLSLSCVVFPDAMRAALGAEPGGPVAPSAGANSSTFGDSGDAGAGPGGNEADLPGPASHPRAYLTLPVITKLLGLSGNFPKEVALSLVTELVKNGVARMPEDFRRMAARVSALPPPNEILRRMAPYCCANPVCFNLEGPSEAALPRHRCGGGCGGRPWWYCSKECQVAHWRAGHMVECKAAGARAAGGSQGPTAGDAALGQQG